MSFVAKKTIRTICDLTANRPMTISVQGPFCSRDCQHFVSSSFVSNCHLYMRGLAYSRGEEGNGNIRCSPCLDEFGLPEDAV